MKKAILILASALMCISVSAQEFNPHWYLQVRGGAAETIGETNFVDLLSPAADLSLGYQFTPAFGLRGNVLGWQAKGAMSAINAATEVYKFNFAQAALDATFDICNIFNTNLDRVLSPYAYLGIGANARFNNDEAQALAPKTNGGFEYLWDGTQFAPSGRAGLGFDIRLSDAIKLNLEAGVNALTDHFNSKRNERAGKLPDMDYQYTGLIGLKFALGPTKKAAPAPVVVPPAPAPAPAPKPEPKPEPKPVVVEQPAPAPAPELQENIYFIINKWDIQASEVAKLDEIAAFMAQNPDTKVKLTGHADKDTGTAQRNLFLSEKRAEVVTNELIKRGVAASRISSTFKGDTANPFATPEENRVTVCFVK